MKKEKWLSKEALQIAEKRKDMKGKGEKERYAGYIMQNAGLDEAQGGIKIAMRNIINLKYADDTTFMAESEEELQSFLMKVKE